jgi:hypothetical protein
VGKTVNLALVRVVAVLQQRRKSSAAKAHRSKYSPPCCSSYGFRGVRAWLVGNFHAIEICAAVYRLTLGTFETMHEAARTYNAVRRLGC